MRTLPYKHLVLNECVCRQDTNETVLAMCYDIYIYACMYVLAYRGMSGMKKDPLLAAAPKAGALEGSPRCSAELLLSVGPRFRREPARFVSRPRMPWREAEPRASWELSLPHRASWELLLEPGPSGLPPKKGRELPRAGGVSICRLSLQQLAHFSRRQAWNSQIVDWAASG